MLHLLCPVIEFLHSFSGVVQFLLQPSHILRRGEPFDAVLDLPEELRNVLLMGCEVSAEGVEELRQARRDRCAADTRKAAEPFVEDRR